MKALVFHPIEPWLAYADVNQVITVWDWSNQQVSFCIFDLASDFQSHCLDSAGSEEPLPLTKHACTHRQVVWETQLGGADESAMQDAMLQRLAEKEAGYYGNAGIPRPGATAKGAAPGAVSYLRNNAVLQAENVSEHPLLLSNLKEIIIMLFS